MLTKLEKQFLRFCRSQGGSDVASADIADALGCSSAYELYLCAKSLEKNEYLEDLTVFINGDFVVTLNHKGSHFDEISKLEAKRFIIRSILVPVGVSVVTTLVLHLLKYLIELW